MLNCSEDRNVKPKYLKRWRLLLIMLNLISSPIFIYFMSLQRSKPLLLGLNTFVNDVARLSIY